MISMGAFVASGGMETLRYHATAVNIGDVLIDEADDQTFFVDFRFRFISEQARSFFIKQNLHRSVVESGLDVVHGIYPAPKKLVSLVSDDPGSKSNDVNSRGIPSKPLEQWRSGGKVPHRVNSLRYKEVPQSVSGPRRGSSQEENRSPEQDKAVYLPDTQWIARTEALSTILRPTVDAGEPLIKDARNDADTNTDKHGYTAGLTYQSDSKSDSSGQTTDDVSDDEFSFVGPRSRRSSSLAETQDSVELTRNYWDRNRLIQKRSSREKSEDGVSFRRQRGKEAKEQMTNHL